MKGLLLCGVERRELFVFDRLQAARGDGRLFGPLVGEVDDGAAAIGGVAVTSDERLFLELVEQPDHVAGVEAQRLRQPLLPERPMLVEQLQQREDLPRAKRAERVSGGMTPDSCPVVEPGPTPVVAVTPVVLAAPGRGDDLQVKAPAPTIGRELPTVVLCQGFGSSSNGDGPLVDGWAAVPGLRGRLDRTRIAAAEHSLGVLPDDEAKETTDEHPACVAMSQQITRAYLRCTLYPGVPSCRERATAREL